MFIMNSEERQDDMDIFEKGTPKYCEQPSEVATTCAGYCETR
jgi:hypothetical protein